MTNSVTFGDKKISYYEDFWTGKKTIIINGQILKKVDKKTYKYEDEYCFVKGNYFTGVELTIGVQRVTVVRKLTVFETILCFLPLLMVILGGAVGGVCGGMACAFNAAFIRKNDKVILQILCSLASAVVAFVVYSIISILLIGLII